MNSKAIKRQLLAAIAMVLVAALALGSSTYAWFANNNTVTADGLSITAQAEGKLLIIDDNSGFTNGNKTYLKMTANEAEATKLLPTHPVYTLGGTLTAWNHNTSDTYNKAISGTTSEAAVTNGTDSKFYYLSDEVYIKLAGNGGTNTASNLKLSNLEIKATGGEVDGTLLNSVRVMLVVNDAKAYVYNKDGKEVTVDGSADGNTAFTFASDISAASQLAAEVNTTTPIKVAVYVYFDGRDPDCTSANYDTDNFAVELGFSVDA